MYAKSRPVTCPRQKMRPKKAIITGQKGLQLCNQVNGKTALSYPADYSQLTKATHASSRPCLRAYNVAVHRRFQSVTYSTQGVYVVTNLGRGGDRALLTCGVNRCGAQYPRRENLAAAVQADPGLRVRSEQMAGGLSDEPNTFIYQWNQDSPGVGPALDEVSMEDLKLRFETVKKVNQRTRSVVV